MSTSGISSQQYLNQAEGIRVIHRENPNVVAEVVKNGCVVASFPDDRFSTGAYWLFETMWDKYRATKPVVFNYTTQPAAVFYGSFKVADVLSHFNREVFEERVLPLMEASKDRALRDYAEQYPVVRGIPGRAGEYALYDYIVRVFVYFRYHSMHVDAGVPDEVVDVSVGMANAKEHGAFDVTEGEVFLPALQALFPQGKLVDDGHRKVFVVGSRQSVLSVIGGKDFEPDLDYAALFDGKLDVAPPVECSARSITVAYDGDLLADYCESVRRLYNTPHQTAVGVDSDVLKYRSGLTDKYKIGTSALRGVASSVKSRRLDGAICEVADWLRGKNGSMVPNEALKYAASIIASWKGARKVEVLDGVLHLSPLKA